MLVPMWSPCWLHFFQAPVHSKGNQRTVLGDVTNSHQKHPRPISDHAYSSLGKGDSHRRVSQNSLHVLNLRFLVLVVNLGGQHSVKHNVCRYIKSILLNQCCLKEVLHYYCFKNTIAFLFFFLLLYIFRSSVLSLQMSSYQHFWLTWPFLCLSEEHLPMPLRQTHKI